MKNPFKANPEPKPPTQAELEHKFLKHGSRGEEPMSDEHKAGVAVAVALAQRDLNEAEAYHEAKLRAQADQRKADDELWAQIQARRINP